MFTGIIETVGVVESIQQSGSNFQFGIQSNISKELKVDQSLSHNGVCLTVTEVDGNTHYVTAIAETLNRSNLNHLKKGDIVNLERAMIANARFDGHMVQGHVDATGECHQIEILDGSWYFHFKHDPGNSNLLVDKGSICINGVSLTLVSPYEDQFKVAIIPYTFEHTNFKNLSVGDQVNLEYDIIGKYFAKYAQAYLKNS